MSKIMFVHPNLKACEAMESILSKDGHEVWTAHGGASAIKVFQKQKPDIVILNQELPRLRPFETFSELKKIDPAAKVLVFALLADAEDPREPPRFGIRALSPFEVLEAVARLVDHERRPRSPEARARLLIVDDDYGVRNALKRFLEEVGYAVISARDGHEAVVLHETYKPQLILLDIDMPKMTGVETLKRIRHKDEGVGIMMITGNDTLEMMAQCRDYGAYDYVLKPFDLDYLAFSVYSKILLMTL